MKRIFIAIKVVPGEAFIKMYASVKALLGSERITWMNPDNIHLTIVFLGDTEEERIKIASVVLHQNCAGFGEFSFNLEGTGVFKSFRDPKVIWAGIRKSERLLTLNRQITSGLKNTGFKIEERQFNPHVTIGRVRSVSDPEILKAAVSRYSDTFFRIIDVKEVVLYESILKPTGPVYHPLSTFRLL